MIEAQESRNSGKGKTVERRNRMITGNAGFQTGSNDGKKTELWNRYFCREKVLATIAGLAAVDVPGVAGMSGGFVDGLTELLGRKNLSKGIKIELGEKEIAVDAAIVAENGRSIPEVAETIRKNIVQSIESMTGLRVREVNIRVQGLKLDAQTQETPVPMLAGAR